MNWLVRALSTSVGQKFVMGITGLLLCGFLVVHLGGNLLLYIPDGGQTYEMYAEKLHAQPLLPVAEIGLFGLFFLHIALAVSTIRRNRAARQERYAVKHPKKPGGLLIFDPSYWMPLTGVVVLGFLIVHLCDFKFMGWTRPELPRNGDAVSFEAAKVVLTSPYALPVYAAGSILLGIHLAHGVASAFQTLGVNHPKYNGLIKAASVAFAAVIAVGFASFPIWAWLTH